MTISINRPVGVDGAEWFQYPQDILDSGQGMEYFNARYRKMFDDILGREGEIDITQETCIVPVYNFRLNRVVGEIESELSFIEIDAFRAIKDNINELKCKVEAEEDKIDYDYWWREVFGYLRLPLGAALSKREYVVRSVGRRIAWLHELCESKNYQERYPKYIKDLEQILHFMRVFVEEAEKDIEDPYLSQHELAQKKTSTD